MAIAFSGTGIILTLSILSSIKGILLAHLSGLTTGAIGLLLGRYLPKTKDEQLDMLESRSQQLKKTGDAELLDSVSEKYRETLGLPPKTKDEGKYLPPGE
ncbi:MAG: hypothetical protein QNJ42_00880 [Crocosphaera sp.]|nr:hypothetical protein [Crocosphaera sp.]